MCFNGTINNDILGLEGDEQFRLTLFNLSPSEVGIGLDTTTITIEDDECMDIAVDMIEIITYTVMVDASFNCSCCGEI